MAIILASCLEYTVDVDMQEHSELSRLDNLVLQANSTPHHVTLK